MNPATRQFIETHRYDDVQKLALQYSTRANSEIDIPSALRQISGRQHIEHKIPAWYSNDDILYPQRLSLEQCSSETTARYKASILSGSSFVDLTGGFGVDTAFIAPHFSQVEYVEKQNELAEIAQHNFSALGLKHIQTHSTDSISFLQNMHSCDCIYLDPARRSHSGEKVLLIEDCEPDVLEIQDVLLQKAERILVKLSPMLDIQAALKQLKNVSEIHVVSVGNECKELLFLMEKAVRLHPKISCVNFQKQATQCDIFDFSEEKKLSIDYHASIQNYLYEPNASLLKAGFYKSIALRYAVDKLHTDSHLYTSNRLIADFPGRIFQVESIALFHKKELKSFLQGITQANISVRNFPLSVAELRKQLKLKEGGDVYLFATTLADGKRVIVHTKKQPAVEISNTTGC
ncbi:MAG: hypothetical protein EZS26_001845 [Candidatus Ordinivivax streblomastigis]|uniref:Uncharacterized protein n=1 Tax=Candidatus Ordinivivax streblomastigis TaxID=2540710 RepID=A0A5M8P0S2_9BACT|nr:MAG: hypothetical protein EZS26_001845 [Candidatus Ordinivivax streblomastigis]